MRLEMGEMEASPQAMRAQESWRRRGLVVDRLPHDQTRSAARWEGPEQ
jgi:hypothetical protein